MVLICLCSAVDGIVNFGDKLRSPRFQSHLLLQIVILVLSFLTNVITFGKFGGFFFNVLEL